VKKGLATGDNRRFYCREIEGRGNYELVDHSRIMSSTQLASLSEQERLHGVDPEQHDGRYLVPLDKGENAEIERGWLPNYYVKHKFYVDWSERTVQDLYALGGMRNPHYQFRQGISFSWTGFYAPTFRLNTGYVFDQSSSCIFQNEYEIELLLAILASRTAKYVTKVFCDHTVNSTASVIERIVIPAPGMQGTDDIQSLARRIIDKQMQDPRYDYVHSEQKQINALVYRAYGLSDNTIRDIELWYCRRYRTLAEIEGFIVEVQAKYAAHLARCQRILEKPPSYWRSNPILELVAEGESNTLEFKETLEYAVRTRERDANVRLSSLKTLAGFLNADGGTLLIGVNDAGEIKGIQRDLRYMGRINYDRYEQLIRNYLRDRFEPSPIGKVSISFEELQEGTVCRVDVSVSEEIVHLDGEIYVRDGNKTQKLEGRDRTEWIRQRGNRTRETDQPAG